MKMKMQLKILHHLCHLIVFFCTFSNILSCLCALGCPVNTYQSEERICVPCPANSHTTGDGNIREGCICDEGFTGPAGGPCHGNVSCLHSNHCFQVSGGLKAGSHLPFAFPEDVKFILTLCKCKHWVRALRFFAIDSILENAIADVMCECSFSGTTNGANFCCTSQKFQIYWGFREIFEKTKLGSHSFKRLHTVIVFNLM